MSSAEDGLGRRGHKEAWKDCPAGFRASTALPTLRVQACRTATQEVSLVLRHRFGDFVVTALTPNTRGLVGCP